MAKKFAFAKGIATGVVATAATYFSLIAEQTKSSEPVAHSFFMCLFTKSPNLQY